VAEGDPLVIQPVADASTMAVFEWERARAA